MNDNNAVLTKHIGFRISPEIFERIQNQASHEAIPANVWCRERIIEASERHLITPGEKTILAEILVTQEIIVKLLYAIVWEGKPSGDRFSQITTAAHAGKEELVRRLLEESLRESERKGKVQSEECSAPRAT